MGGNHYSARKFDKDQITSSENSLAMVVFLFIKNGFLTLTKDSFNKRDRNLENSQEEKSYPASWSTRNRRLYLFGYRLCSQQYNSQRNSQRYILTFAFVPNKNYPSSTSQSPCSHGIKKYCPQKSQAIKHFDGGKQ